MSTIGSLGLLLFLAMGLLGAGSLVCADELSNALETRFRAEKPPFELLRRSRNPFWRKNSRVFERLRQRDILVSVQSDEFDVERGDESIEMKRLTLNGAGVVEADIKTSRLEIKKFHQLRSLSPDHFVEIRESRTEPVVFIHGVALGWHARMHLLIDEEVVSPSLSRLHFLVKKGSFQGMKGFVELKSLDQGESGGPVQNDVTSHQNIEFSMTAIYESEKLPMPSFLLSFGLEAVMKIVAKKMRKHLEKVAGVKKAESRPRKRTKQQEE